MCSEKELQGVNTREDLIKMDISIQNDIKKKLIKNGVTIFQPETVRVSHDTKIDKDCIIEPFVVINGDGSVDFLVGVNNGKYESFINQTNSDSYALRLPDFPRGKKYIGSKIWVYFNNDSVQIHELFAGGGYLSQSAPIIFIGNKKNIKKIILQWPDGTKNEIHNY